MYRCLSHTVLIDNEMQQALPHKCPQKAIWVINKHLDMPYHGGCIVLQLLGHDGMVTKCIVLKLSGHGMVIKDKIFLLDSIYFGVCVNHDGFHGDEEQGWRNSKKEEDAVIFIKHLYQKKKHFSKNILHLVQNKVLFEFG